MPKNNFQDLESKASTPKRGLHSSPTDSSITPEHQRVQKVQKMSEYADKNDIQELKKLILTNTNMLEERFKQINNSLTIFRDEMIETKKAITTINARLDLLENAEKNDDMISQLNALKQVQIETQVSIHNIPENIDTKHALECFSSWSNTLLNEENVKYSSLVKVKDNPHAILFLEFYNVMVKHKFMKHVRLMQKDKDKKYIPILTDHIFKLEALDPGKGIQLHFRDAITDYNREIFNAARKEKKIFSNVWISRGYVMVRISNTKPVKVTSMSSLNSLISSHKNVR
jgi:hypothetical protein